MQPLWNELAARGNIVPSDVQHALLHQYLDLLFDANARMNLTGIADRAAAEISHIGDALTLLPFLPPSAHRLVDIGTGGGVPGIPLAIVRPDVTVMLIESTQKKALFLEATIRELKLENVRVLAARAEAAGRSDLRETYDVAVARAVAAMNVLVEWCLPMVKKGGKFLAMKGPKVMAELPEAQRAIRLLGGGDPIVHPVQLQGTSGHLIVEIAKITRTDNRYPRPAAGASKRPL